MLILGGFWLGVLILGVMIPCTVISSRKTFKIHNLARLERTLASMQYLLTFIFLQAATVAKRGVKHLRGKLVLKLLNIASQLVAAAVLLYLPNLFSFHLPFLTFYLGSI